MEQSMIYGNNQHSPTVKSLKASESEYLLTIFDKNKISNRNQ